VHYYADGSSLFEKAMTVFDRSVTHPPTARSVAALTIWLCLALPAWAEHLDPSAVNNAQFSSKAAGKDKLDPAVVKAEILLDRARFSPGEIGGKLGENAKKALKEFALANSLPAGNALTDDLWAKLVASSQDPVITDYKIVESDLKGPFLKKQPTKLEDMKDLKSLGYSSPREEIAERFHMSEDLLGSLNPGKQFDKVGDTISVANVLNRHSATIGKIEVYKATESVKAFDASGALVAYFPASIGSEEKPTPTGTFKVASSDANPNYRYNPDYKFKGVKTKKPFDIMPGPNNPVGSYWIGLSAEGYGIHGTPNPSKVGKSESHGCVRLTNWDVAWLGKNVKKGTQVVFIDN
jgi:lipoprotein-anchoring transpeptidase ErfK/SrfK